MGDDCELVHPVDQRVTFLDNTLEIAPDTGNQLIASHRRGPRLLREQRRDALRSEDR